MTGPLPHPHASPIREEGCGHPVRRKVEMALASVLKVHAVLCLIRLLVNNTVNEKHVIEECGQPRFCSLQRFRGSSRGQG
jgi:hypothetical protein